MRGLDADGDPDLTRMAVVVRRVRVRLAVERAPSPLTAAQVRDQLAAQGVHASARLVAAQLRELEREGVLASDLAPVDNPRTPAHTPAWLCRRYRLRPTFGASETGGT